MLACHWLIAISPRLQVVLLEPAPQLPLVALPSRTGVDRPSTSMSFHWSNTVSLQSPSGRPDSVKLPSAAHLAKAKSSPSGSPKLT